MHLIPWSFLFSPFWGCGPKQAPEATISPLWPTDPIQYEVQIQRQGTINDRGIAFVGQPNTIQAILNCQAKPTEKRTQRMEGGATITQNTLNEEVPDSFSVEWRDGQIKRIQVPDDSNLAHEVTARLLAGALEAKGFEGPCETNHSWKSKHLSTVMKVGLLRGPASTRNHHNRYLKFFLYYFFLKNKLIQ